MERTIQLPMGVISGWCVPEFESLLTAFVKNFTDHGELGAGLALVQGDEVLVDLIGGMLTGIVKSPGRPTPCVLCTRVPKRRRLCVCIF